MNWYELSRQFFDFSFEHHECGVYHTAIYMLAIEQNNRYGWKKEFWFPTAYNCDVLGIGNRNTYLSALKDLVDWWFIEIICESKNQFKATVISLCHIKIDIATDTAWYTALDKALIWQGIWHWYAIDTIDKQVNKETTKQWNHETKEIIPKNTEDKEIQKTKKKKVYDYSDLLSQENSFAKEALTTLTSMWWTPSTKEEEFISCIDEILEMNHISKDDVNFKKWKYALNDFKIYWSSRDERWKKPLYLSKLRNSPSFRFNLPKNV